MYLNFGGTCKSSYSPQISYQVLFKIQKQPKNKSTWNLSHSNPLMRSGGESTWNFVVTLFTGNIYNISNSCFVFVIVVPSFFTTQPLLKLAMPAGLLCMCWAQVCVSGRCMWGGMWPKVIPHRGDLAEWKIPQWSTAQIPSLHFKSAGSGLGIHTDSSTLTFRENHGLFSEPEYISRGAGVHFLQLLAPEQRHLPASENDSGPFCSMAVLQLHSSHRSALGAHTQKSRGNRVFSPPAPSHREMRLMQGAAHSCAMNCPGQGLVVLHHMSRQPQGPTVSAELGIYRCTWIWEERSVPCIHSSLVSQK